MWSMFLLGGEDNVRDDEQLRWWKTPLLWIPFSIACVFGGWAYTFKKFCSCKESVWWDCCPSWCRFFNWLGLILVLIFFEILVWVCGVIIGPWVLFYYIYKDARELWNNKIAHRSTLMVCQETCTESLPQMVLPTYIFTAVGQGLKRKVSGVMEGHYIDPVLFYSSIFASVLAVIKGLVVYLYYRDE